MKGKNAFIVKPRKEATCHTILFIYLFIYLCLFRAAPMAYGVSQAMG